MKVQAKSALNARQKFVLGFITVLWLLVTYVHWAWWLSQSHTGNVILYTAFSLGTFYVITFLPSMYLFYLWNMAKPVHIPVKRAKEAGVIRKVALITLTVVGSESYDIVRRQLEAMINVRYPHDSWLLVDGKHDPKLEALCLYYGVYYFCRHQEKKWGLAMIKRWNASEPPFKAKTKAGNVNAWLDAVGRRYSHFTQFDIDHNPRPDYLHRVLGYFVDPEVKWVQAPSVYGNMDAWTARGSAEQELVLQGPLQMGFFGWSRTPFIIGSHCTYDTNAVLEIGGFQPTRAEDHLDTVELAALGYRGVFVPEVIAVGDGPEDFVTYLQQQFAWAYSLMSILFWHTPRLLHKYGTKRVIQFMFAQTWYPLWSGASVLLFLLPTIGLLTGESIASVSYWDYVLHSTPIAAVGMLIWKFSGKWQKPTGIGLTWRGVILHIARWPVIFSALIQVLLKVEKPYMITPKGMGHDGSFSIKAHSASLVLIVVNLTAVVVSLILQPKQQNYVFFALQGAAFLYLVYGVVLAKSGWQLRFVWRRKSALLVFALLSVTLLGVSQLAAPTIARVLF